MFKLKDGELKFAAASRSSRHARAAIAKSKPRDSELKFRRGKLKLAPRPSGNRKNVQTQRRRIEVRRGKLKLAPPR